MRTKLSIIRIPTLEEFKKLFSLKCKYTNNSIEIWNNQNYIQFDTVHQNHYYLTSSYLYDLIYIIYPDTVTALTTGRDKYKIRLVSESLLPGFVDLGVGIYWAANDCKELYKAEEAKELIKLV